MIGYEEEMQRWGGATKNEVTIFYRCASFQKNTPLGLGFKCQKYNEVETLIAIIGFSV